MKDKTAAQVLVAIRGHNVKEIILQSILSNIMLKEKFCTSNNGCLSSHVFNNIKKLSVPHILGMISFPLAPRALLVSCNFHDVAEASLLLFI